MRMMKRLRQRAVVVVVLLCAASGIGWAVSSQASARGAAAITSPTPPVAPRPQGAPTRVATPMAMATNVHCGETITASVTLNGDLYCSGITGAGALTIAGTTVTVNLNGHTLSADRSGACIAVEGTSDIVENGFVSGCSYGVYLNGSKETATKLTVTASMDGVLDFGLADKLVANTTLNNTNTGVIVSGSGATVSGNHSASNNWGMYVQDAHATVSNNSTDDNVYNGIDLGGAGSVFTANSLDYNGSDGFVGNGYAIIDGGSNTAHGNDYIAGATPEQCSGIACS